MNSSNQVKQKHRKQYETSGLLIGLNSSIISMALATCGAFLVIIGLYLWIKGCRVNNDIVMRNLGYVSLVCSLVALVLSIPVLVLSINGIRLFIDCKKKKQQKPIVTLILSIVGLAHVPDIIILGFINWFFSMFAITLSYE